MERMIADAIGVESGCVSVKAKTAEGLGPVGAGDALCAQAVALIA
jgi:2-C-methyl-D-erythritol 2,4-cyclodiphosphate synthase